MIVGGGTVGIELTGELANAFPGLDITIVEATDQILGTPGYTDALRNEISEQLAVLGVRVVPAPSWPTCPRKTSATSPTSWRDQEGRRHRS